METKEIEYFYTWKGLDSWQYRTYKEALDEVNRKGLKNVYPPGLEYEKEAEAFCKGELDKYIQDHYKPFETEADAVIYTDGSYDVKNKTASYGLIIFFRGGRDLYMESGSIEDVDAVKYKIVRYDESGNEMKDDDNIREIVRDHKDDGKKSFLSSQSVTGELSGAMRGLEICCQKRKLKKILVVYDCEFVKTVYDNRKKPYEPEGYAAGAYRKLLLNLEDADIQFIKVDSHNSKSKNKHQYLIEADGYLHAVYNDLVDILAKAETGKTISPKENINVFRAVSDEFRRFSDIGAVKKEEQRKFTRELIKMVWNKSDGLFRPIFIDR